jgi:hypothetical protein
MCVEGPQEESLRLEKFLQFASKNRRVHPLDGDGAVVQSLAPAGLAPVEP